MLDAFAVILSGIVSYQVQPVMGEFIPALKEVVPVQHFITQFVLWIPIWVAVDIATGLHRVFDRILSVRELVWGILKLHGIFFLAISAISYATQLALNRSLVLIFFTFSILSMFLVRQLVSSRLKVLHEKGIARKNVVLVGNCGPAMREYVSTANSHPYSPKILGRLTTEDPACEEPPPGMPIVGDVSELGAYLDTMPVDEVVFFEPHSNPAENADLLSICEELGIPAFFSINLDQPTDAAPRFAMRHEMPFVLFDVSPKRPELLTVKNAFDVLAASILIVLFSPVMLVTALSILFSMGRPVLFFQKRVGRQGREFDMVKFRTMKIGAERQRDDLLENNEMDGPVFKIAKDPRITPLGRFLRRTSIDELPQLFNVLNGTMSLVGPRPLPVKEQQDIRGWRRRRLSMKPGITGLWQVSGRSEVTFEEWMKMDLEYIDRWSIWLDIKLLFKTVYTVLIAKGAK